MATGGVFTIIANDGKADKMIMATDLLRQRIEQVRCARRAARAQGLPGYDDDTPTLVDVERSHILYVNAHFKPFAAIGYEYQRVPPQQGTPGWRADLVYSIPQFGDFFYDMVLHMNLQEVQASSVLPATALAGGTTGQPGGAPTHTDLLAGAPAVRTITHTRYVSPSGAVLWDPNGALNGTSAVATPVAARNYVHYCEFPAERTVTQVQFQVNGNPLDEYNSDTYSFYEKFRVRPGKRFGWNRSVGQEIPTEGYSNICVSGTANGVIDPTGDISRQLIQVVNGAQTPKPLQPAQEWWLKLLLWFNEDVRLAVPSVSIPYGQRYINVKIAPQSEVVFTSGAGFIWEQKITTITYNAVTPVLPDVIVPANAFATSVAVTMISQPVLLPGSVLDENAQRIISANLYINNIFVNPEIHDIYIKRIGFNLIRVHRTANIRVNSDAQDVLLSQLKWPIEYFYAGLRPTENDAPTNPYRWRNWHRYVKPTQHVCMEPTAVQTVQLPMFTTNAAVDALNFPGTAAAPALPAGPQTSANTFISYTGADGAITYWTQEKTIDRLTISAHSIPIYNDIPSGFFNSHIPFQYGGVNIQTPYDEGALLINFCLYPGTYQPSGHFNVSRAREFYFIYTSSVIDSDYPGKLILDASALNFLLISDGSAVLRYTT